MAAVRSAGWPERRPEGRKGQRVGNRLGLRVVAFGGSASARVLEHAPGAVLLEEIVLAVDPKGAIGDLELEVGAALRNPQGMPSLMLPDVIDRRIGQFSSGLVADPERILRWAFAQAVLACVWMIEDDIAVTRGTPATLFARETVQWVP